VNKINLEKGCGVSVGYNGERSFGNVAFLVDLSP